MIFWGSKSIKESFDLVCMFFFKFKEEKNINVYVEIKKMFCRISFGMLDFIYRFFSWVSLENIFFGREFKVFKDKFLWKN